MNASSRARGTSEIGVGVSELTAYGWILADELYQGLAAAGPSFSQAAVVSALNVIFQRNPVHCVLWLILTFFNAAGLFVLLGAEWPSRALLLAEVIVPDGQHHLVLIVRTKETDLVLDNLSPNVRSVSVTYRHYQWVRVETPQNPKFWVRVRTPRGVQTAALSRHVF